MKPVVLVERTAMGDAVRYSRIVNGLSTDIVETETVEGGQPVKILKPEDVELFRVDPKKLA